jgi:hypothetical protein
LVPKSGSPSLVPKSASPSLIPKAVGDDEFNKHIISDVRDVSKIILDVIGGTDAASANVNKLCSYIHDDANINM